MTRISAKVIKASEANNHKIVTMEVTFPRFILAELNTHRMFSRNSASSRAIPFAKMIKSVKENPFIPIAWQKDHSGMQGTEYLDTSSESESLRQWLFARDKAVSSAEALNNLKLTKQLCNRLLEPFMWHTVLITATEWENFFALRCPQYVIEGVNNNKSFRSKKDVYKKLQSHESFNLKLNDFTELDWLQMNKGQAEIHMMALAEAMWDAYNEAKFEPLKEGEWHIPFVEFDERMMLPDDVLIKVATARCARVSYTVVGEEGKEPNIEKDIELHDKLATSGHWSPFEHCARVMFDDEYNTSVNGTIENCAGNYPSYLPTKGSEGWSGNFRGFIQYRKTFENENITK